MIKKIITIKNLGTFKNHNASGGEFKKFNIIYGENGSGKSTIVTIFRSLKTNNNDILVGRRCLGSKEDIKIDVLTDKGNQIFENNNWKSNYEDIEIFDSKFISDNIHSGYIDIAHRRNLQDFIIGELGVIIAKRIAEIDNETRNILSPEISKLEKEINSKIFDSFDINKFIYLENIDDINNKIELKEKEYNLILNQEKIRKLSFLDKLEFDYINCDMIIKLFENKFDNISSEAMGEVINYIKVKLDDEGKEWLSKGTSYIKDDSCPFCTQSIINIKIVNYFKQFFNKQYNEFVTINLEKLNNLKSISFGNMRTINALFNSNKTLIETWNEYFNKKIYLLDLDLVEIEKKIIDLRKLIDSDVEKKKNRIHEKKGISLDLKTKIEEYEKLYSDIEKYNDQISVVNKEIKLIKKNLDKDNTQFVYNDLVKLKNIKIRFDKDIIDLVTLYIQKRKHKMELEEEKSTKKDEIDNLNKKILIELKDEINKVLKKCGTNFEIVETKTEYPGGKASLTYKIKINSISFNLGDYYSPDSIPSFKNTLSEGDKSTLAFAFFISKCIKDPNIANKVIVFDDPVSSFDLHRKEATISYMNKINNLCKQMFIMSQDPAFSNILWVKTKISSKDSFKVLKTTESSIVIPFNIKDFNEGDYFHNYMILFDYLNEQKGNKENVAKTIRIILEGNLKFRYPKSFNIENKWLGDFIKLINESDNTKEYFILKGDQITELEEINEYSKKFHHDSNTITCDYELSSINEIELKTFVERTLSFCTK